MKPPMPPPMNAHGGSGGRRDAKRSGRPMARTQIVAPEEGVEQEGYGELSGTLTLLSDPNPGATFVLDEDELVIGRTPDASLYIEDAGLSRAHARFYRRGTDYLVEDLKSTNGTSVNGERITMPTLLADGARVQAGKGTVLRFQLQDRLEQAAAQRLYEQTVRDALTGLHNRRFLEDRLRSEFAYADRHNTPLSVLIIDVDHFKRVNDEHGHPAGDEVLRVMGKTLSNMVRTEDLAARYGGEEFVVATRGSDKTEAVALANRIREAVMDNGVQWNNSPIAITVSVGVATLGSKPYTSATGLVAAADSALYSAKQNGRNQVVLADQ